MTVPSASASKYCPSVAGAVVGSVYSSKSVSPLLLMFKNSTAAAFDILTSLLTNEIVAVVKSATCIPPLASSSTPPSLPVQVNFTLPPKLPALTYIGFSPKLDRVTKFNGSLLPKLK